MCEFYRDESQVGWSPQKLIESNSLSSSRDGDMPICGIHSRMPIAGLA